MPSFEVCTARLRLYPIGDDEMRGMIAAEPDPEMKGAYGEMLAGCLMKPTERQWYAVWVMECPARGGIVVGDLCFKGVRPDGAVEIGYGIRPPYEGQGYTTEAVAALTRWALAQPGITRVEAEIEPTNAASRRVLEKAGFVENGVQGEEGPRFVWAGEVPPETRG